MRIPPTHSPVPPRSLGVSLLALAVAVGGNLILAGEPGSHELLLWLLALVPAFLLAYHRGWRGVTLALVGGMALIAATEIAVSLEAGIPADPLLLSAVIAAFVGASLGAGWLADALHRARMLAEKSSLEVIMLLTPDGRIRYASPAVESILGISRDEAPGTSIQAILHSEDQEDVRDLLAWLAEEPDRNGELTVRVRDGRGGWRILHALARNLLDDSAVRGIVVSARDRTERRQAEIELREAYAWDHAIFEGSRDAIFVSDREGRFVRVNRAACELTGYGRERLLSMAIPDLHEEPDLAAYREHHAAILAGRERVTEARILRRDGKKVPTEFNSRRVEIGGDVYMHTVARDMTERVERERELEQANARFDAFMRHLPAAASVRDQEGRFLFLNPEGERILGLDSEEWLGRRADEVLPGPVAAALLEGDRRLQRDGGPLIETEVQFPFYAGHRIDVYRFTIPDPDGDAPLLAGIFLDVTERWESREHLRETQKMEEMGHFTAGIAHDFNNLLAIILSNSESLLEELSDPPITVREAVGDIRRTSRRGANLVRRLLAFSKRGEVNIQTVDLAEILDALKSPLQRLLTPRIRVQVLVEESLPAVRFDATSLEQILLNLSTNARDAIPGSGTITFRAHPTTLGIQDQKEFSWAVPGEYVRLSVVDSGEGMDRETLARIFEPLYTTKERGHGTGLGLAVVYGLVKQQRGLIQVYSEPGEGTAFNLYLPVADVDEVAQSATDDPSGMSEGDEIPEGCETILVIEDEEALRRSAERVLARLGYEVLTAASGEEGMDIYRSRPDEIALVLSDQVMPGMSGTDVLQALRKKPTDLRFILMSGWSPQEGSRGKPGDGSREGAGEALAAEVPFLQKPWSISDLAQLVRQEIERETVES